MAALLTVGGGGAKNGLGAEANGALTAGAWFWSKQSNIILVTRAMKFTIKWYHFLKISIQLLRKNKHHY
jgi:hypothetical protein